MQWEKNQFDGVVIEPESLSLDDQSFYLVLKNNIDTWKNDSVKLVWLQINKEFYSKIHIASQFGFIMHHASPNYVMMTLAIEIDTFIPPCLLYTSPSPRD